MAACNNCGTNLTCSCKVRIALDKKQCCTACVTIYNQKLEQNLPNRNQISPPPPGANLWH